MRIDLFLKLSRLVKRRAAAREMVEMGAVKLNGRTVKPSAEVRLADRIEIAYPRRVVLVEVISEQARPPQGKNTMFCVLEDRRVEEDGF
jgi:ribosomal 50S subunit-recycling heat shock protein